MKKSKFIGNRMVKILGEQEQGVMSFLCSHQLFACTVVVLCLIACNHSGLPGITQNKTQGLEAPSGDLAARVGSGRDTTRFADEIYPLDSSFSTKVLRPGTYHGDEVAEHADKAKWFGLFHGKTGYYLDETKLKTKRVNDPVVDESEHAETGWEVQTTNKDSAIILVEWLSYLSAHKVDAVTLAKDRIYPDDTLNLSYAGREYHLFATGGKQNAPDNIEWFDVWNYKLYVTTTVNGQEHKSLLVAQPNFDDQMITILFAGDIDGDGILDFIIDTSRHYNLTRPTMYLSRPAAKGEVVQPIGSFTSVGC